MKQMFFFVAHLFCRLHLWTAAILTLTWVSPFCGLPESSRERCLYAITMERTSHRVRNSVARILRREQNRSSDGNIWLALAAWRIGKLRIASHLLREASFLAPGNEDPRLAEHLRTLAAAHMDGTFRQLVQRSLAEVIVDIDISMSIIVVPVSRNYLDLFRLWAGQVAKNAPTASIVVIALDEQAAMAVREEFKFIVLNLSRLFLVGASGRLHRYSKPNLWILRTFVVRELVTLDRRVIVLDLDAVPIGSVDAMLARSPESDIVAQIEPHSIPVDAARKMGFILCCGFMVFYPTPATKRFLERYAEKVVVEMDDQVALNHILVEEGHPKLQRERHWTRFELAGVRWSCPSADLVSRNEFHGSVIRHFQQTGQTIDELRSRLGLDNAQLITPAAQQP